MRFSANKMIDDYWGPAKRVMGDPKFIENISNFDKRISPSQQPFIL